MSCANCGKTFTPKAKGFKRRSLFSDKRTEQEVESVLNISVTPNTSRDKFVCYECDKRLNLASAGVASRRELFASTSDDSYVGKRKYPEDEPISASTPIKKRKVSPKKVMFGTFFLVSLRCFTLCNGSVSSAFKIIQVLISVKLICTQRSIDMDKVNCIHN